MTVEILVSIAYTSSFSPHESHLTMMLKQTITLVVSDNPSRNATKELVELFHRLAIVYLRKKARTGSLKPDLFGMPIEDVAFDCVADLFNRSAEGVFVELVKYYTSVNYSNLDEDQLLGMTRRLVFSKVILDLHRQYRELDPSLHKLMRNLKEAAASMDSVSIECASDEWWVRFCPAENIEPRLPVIPDEILESHLSSFVTESDRSRAVLGAARDMFSEQSTYRRAYPFLAFAKALRSVYSRLGEIPTQVSEDRFRLTEEEIDSRIEEGVAAVKSSMRHTYVDKGKLDEGTYITYFLAIKDILRNEFIEENHADRSYYDYLSKQMSNLSRESYKETHRIYLEYLVKLTRQRFLSHIKKEL